MSIVRTIHSSKYMATLLAGILAAIFSIGAIDSFGQIDLTTANRSMVDQENSTSMQ